MKVPASPELVYVPRSGLKPFKQGELDGLCGLYAIINAIRWAAWPTQFGEVAARDLFGVLTDHAIKLRGLTSICWYGITVPQLRQLLRRALAHMRTEHGLAFDLEAIPSKAFTPYPNANLRASRYPSSCLGEAFILNLTHATHRHWSVFDTIDKNRLRLFDSGHWQALPLRRVAFQSAFKLAMAQQPE